MNEHRDSKTIVGVALVACLLSLWPDRAAAGETATNAGGWGPYAVGSTIVQIELRGTLGEHRPLDVLLWYPADRQVYRAASRTVYTSRLNGVELDPTRWDPLSWSVEAERARENVPLDAGRPQFPLLVVSHAAAGEPHNYAPTLERLASHGYVIAAPWHTRDTQDDRRIDLINQLAGSTIVPCLDGGPSPCLHGVQQAVQNRALDIAAVLDTIGAFFGERVNTSRVGILGQSRGSISALAAAGGSTPWAIAREPRVAAIMTLAIGTRPVTFSQDLANITIPALLVAGKIDRNTPMAITVDAFDTIPSAAKALVILERAEHRVYGSAYCAQTQAAGAIFQANPRAIGEQITLENIMLNPNSGTSLDWCFYDTFTRPVDITPLIEAMTGFGVMPNNVPRQLDSDTAMRVVLELAVTFFDAALVRQALPDVHFTRYLSPEFLLMKEGGTVSYAESHSFQGRAVACDDPDLTSLDVACED